MHKQFWLSRKVIVNNSVQRRQIQSPSRDVCHKKHGALVVHELAQGDLTSGRI